MISNSDFPENPENQGEIALDYDMGQVTSIQIELDPKEMSSNMPSWIKDIRDSVYTALGGLPGKHNAQSPRFFTSTRVLLLVTIISLALAWVFKQGCLQQTMVNQVLYLVTGGNRSYTAMCYTDLTLDFQDTGGFGMRFPFWPGVHTDPWIQACAPLIKIVLFAIMSLAKFLYPALSWMGLPIGIPAVFFFGVFCVIIAGLWVSIVFMVRALLPYPEHVATALCYLLALSPIAILQVYTSFDVIPVFFTVLSLFLLANNREYMAGLILAFGILSSLSCLVITLAAGIMWIKTRISKYLTVFWMSLQSFFILFAILFFCNYQELISTYTIMFQSKDEMDSIYTSLQNIIGYGLVESHAALIINILCGLLACFLLIWVVCVVKFADSVDIYHIAFLLLAGLLITGKMFKPEFSLWILPLALLACPYTRLLTLWMWVDGVCWFFRCGNLLSKTDSKGLTDQFYGWIAFIRILFLMFVLIATAMSTLDLMIIRKNKRIYLVNKLSPSKYVM